MKTAEELNALKEEIEAINKKLTALSDDELAQVAGGAGDPIEHKIVNELTSLLPKTIASFNTVIFQVRKGDDYRLKACTDALNAYIDALSIHSFNNAQQSMYDLVFSLGGPEFCRSLEDQTIITVLNLLGI